MGGQVLGSVDDQLILVEKLRRAGAATEALAICRDIIAEAPDASAPLLAAAEICDAEGYPDDAIRNFEAAVALNQAGHGDQAALAARNRLAELYDIVSRPDAAAAARRDLIPLAQRDAAEAYARIADEARDIPLYERDEHRLAWSQAVLIYTHAVSEVAGNHVGAGEFDAAERFYRDALRVLADWSEQANAVDGLRRTFETVAQAFGQCHADMAELRERQGDLGGAVYHLEEAWRARRTPSPEERARLGEVAARCAPDIAGICDAVAEFRGTTLPPAAVPITRWDFIRHARRWLVDVEESQRAPVASAQRTIAIPAFNAHHIQMFFALACVLLARGHRVDLIWMPCLDFQRNCDPEPVYENWDEVLLASEMERLVESGLPDGLRLIDLRTIDLAPSSPDFEAAADRLAYIDLRNQYRDTSIDVSEEPNKSHKRNRLLKNLDAMRRMATYLADHPVDRLILFNGGVMEYGAAFHAARAAGVIVVEWEQSAHRRGDFVIAINRCHGDLDMTRIWADAAPHRLTDERRARAAAWLSGKDAASDTSRRPRGAFAPAAPARVLVSELGLDPDKPVAALFPNLTWDTSALDREVVFDSVQDWVLQTAGYFADHPEWQLVVRIHPAEQVRSEEYIGEILRDRWPDLPNNVRIVESRDPLSSYRLLDATQLGLYYTGTLGLEMTMLGIQGVTPARPLYGGYGFTREASTPEEYFGMIRAAFEDPDATALTQNEIDLAWVFADLYMTQTPKSFPWSYQQFWPSVLEEWPMSRVLSEEGIAEFGRVLAVFAGETDLPDGIVGELT